MFHVKHCRGEVGAALPLSPTQASPQIQWSHGARCRSRTFGALTEGRVQGDPIDRSP